MRKINDDIDFNHSHNKYFGVSWLNEICFSSHCGNRLHQTNLDILYLKLDKIT